MRGRKVKLLAAGALGLLVAGAFGLSARRPVRAADHLDPPSRQNQMDGAPVPGNTADIADVYAWHRGTGATASLVTILTFGGPLPRTAGQRIPCDRNVLYGIHISNDADNDAEVNIYARFGMDMAGNCGVQFQNIPGTTSPVSGPVEMTLTQGNVRAFAGLRDDAFFFDLQGFRTTLMTGTLSFVNDRDFFAQQNTPAIVIEMPLSAAMGTATNIRVWGTTARHP